MEEKKSIQRKLVQVEEDYQSSQRQIEASLDEIADEQQRFLHYLEQTVEKIHYTSHKHTNERLHDISSVYRIVEQTQEEGQVIAKKNQKSLEEYLENNHENYKRQRTVYEEKLQLLKKEDE